ncbi:AIPR family protein [Micromonospora aurantiaca (nom. illeg.)]|uniref:AIPR family protein n=1 Tax=Micromonospora aurantiaca (nom. illeg.) TaxID=47850 RepID=UPI003DA21111
MVETHIFRVRATELPAGIPDDANPREANLNRQVYRKVKASLFGAEGSDGTGSFHLKHGGIVLVAEKVEKLDGDRYRLWFNPAVKQGVANGNHSYQLILAAQAEADIPEDQYVEIKVHVNVPHQIVPDLADGLNTSMQVREESLADLRNQFDWLKKVCESRPGEWKPSLGMRVTTGCTTYVKSWRFSWRWIPLATHWKIQSASKTSTLACPRCSSST